MADTLPPWMSSAKPVDDTAPAPAPVLDEKPDWMKSAKLVQAADNYKPILDEKTREAAANDDDAYHDLLTSYINKPGTTVDQIKQIDTEVGRPKKDYGDVEQALKFAKTHGPIKPNYITGSLPAELALGAIRGVQHVIEGGAQLATRAAGATGIISPETATDTQNKLKDFSNRADARFEQGTAGKVGSFIGESAALPIPAVKGAKVLRAGEEVAAPFLSGANALRVAKLGATGAAAGAVTGAERTGADQDAKALLGGALTVLGTPLVEGLVSKVGVPAARAFFDRWQTGVGKKLYDDAGNLTPAGRVLRVRLMHAAPGIDPQLVDASMAQIAKSNPVRLPADKDVIPEMLAQKENVPLTTGMKTRDAKKMQDFESTMAGARGTQGSQDKALGIDSDIDEAILNNIQGIKGNRNTNAQAAEAVGNSVASAAKKAQDTKNALYAPLNQSAERLTRPTDLLGVRDSVVDSLGETGYRTVRKVEPTTAAFIDELSALGRKPNVAFGDLWSLSKRVNEAARAKDASGTLITLKKNLNDYINNATPDAFESGDRGVFDQLQKANAANRDYKSKFFPKALKGMTDSAGMSVQQIRAMANDPDYGPEFIEKAVFGSAKALDSAAAKKAAASVNRIVKAAPDTQQRLKEITLNRLIDNMSDGVSKISGSPSLSPAKASTAINDTIENNRSLLTAVGLTDTEIGRLKANAYLASLKVPPAGARQRGSSATQRGVLAFKQALVRALSAGGAFAGVSLHEGAGPMIASGLAATAGAGAAALKSSKVTRDALSQAAAKAPVDLGEIAIGRGRVKVPLTSIIGRGTRTAASKAGKPSDD